jgi:CRISPR-associated protein Cmr4
MSENSAKRLLIIHALTSLHPGSGTALGIVDLPIQRERHTGWPIIPGSALKGIIRDACRKKTTKEEEKKKLLIVFGPENVQEASSDNSYAGAVSFTDARILAFPVRSLKGVFAWITCAGLLKRLKRDLSLCGLQNEINTIPSVIKTRLG